MIVNDEIVGRVLIVGVGLMGGSLGMALLERGAVREVVGIDSDLVKARSIGAISRAGTNLCQEAADADIVVIAAPITAVCNILQEIAPHVGQDALVTDVASVKAEIASVGQSLLGERFIGGHPMAGSEQTGVGAARSNLYHGAAWALTPISDSTSPRLPLLTDFISTVGAA